MSAQLIHATLLQRPRYRQRGVAIVTALIVVALATLMVAGMMWHQSIGVRKLENQASISQARWLARSSLEYIRLMLAQDARISRVDHYGELWAVPLAETSIDDTAANEGEPAVISGSIVDAQARFNLTNLVRNADIDPIAKATLTRLFKVLRLPESLVEKVGQVMLQQPPPDDLDQVLTRLTRSEAIDAQTAENLKLFVVVLPQPTPININTAPAEVLAACYLDLSLDQARALAQSRDRVFFNQTTDAIARLPGLTVASVATDLAISTNYFEVQGHVRYARAELDVRALIQRDDRGATKVLTMRER